jgi:hypothetical protein
MRPAMVGSAASSCQALATERMAGTQPPVRGAFRMIVVAGGCGRTAATISST